MIRTFVFFSLFWLVLFVSLIVLIPAYLATYIVKRNLVIKFVSPIIKAWAKFTILTTGSKTRISGIDNIPRNLPVAYIGNHQSNMDIPLMIACIPEPAGFLAKKELKKAPFLSQWMQLLGCVFIDRKSIRNSVAAFDKTIEKIKTSQSMIIFPEGTRSRSNKMGVFKEGFLKYLIQENIPIVPFTIINSYRTYEENNRIKSTIINVIFHPLVETNSISEAGIKEKINEIRKTINEPLLKHQ